MGKYNFNAVFILFVFCMIGIISCTKKDKTGTPVYIDAEYKKYFDYKEGTYWVYYDSLTGNTDSMVINNPIHYPPEATSNNMESIYLNLSPIPYDSTKPSWNLELQAPNVYGMQVYVPQEATLDFLTLLYKNPFFTGQNSPKYSTTFLPIYTDGGNSYINVYEVKIQNFQYQYQAIIHLSLDKGIVSALLTGSITPNGSMHLLRYNINL